MGVAPDRGEDWVEVFSVTHMADHNMTAREREDIRIITERSRGRIRDGSIKGFGFFEVTTADAVTTTILEH